MLAIKSALKKHLIQSCLFTLFVLLIKLLEVHAAALSAPRILLPYNRNGGLLLITRSIYRKMMRLIVMNGSQAMCMWLLWSPFRSAPRVAPEQPLFLSSRARQREERRKSSQKFEEFLFFKINIGRGGIELKCDVILDFPDEIKLALTTDELSVGAEPEILTVVAKDRSGHTFTSINGLKFEWKMEQKLDESIDSSDNAVARLKPHLLFKSPSDRWLGLRGLLGSFCARRSTSCRFLQNQGFCDGHRNAGAVHPRGQTTCCLQCPSSAFACYPTTPIWIG
ncbi:nuclear pore membrane glycoprotein 210-like [Caerostris extrusa]|uniref:Nuclear pore membrane glycoprotein 210-like n=1 Tax=Caerostris extrusa TaxID=172846 RepID=A0AAV4UEZ9_CAEEX|nr:nuclear pore membrane glycoprotein 210-like [Caerostris extrusa]